MRFTTRADGDLNADVVAPDVLAARWQAVAERPVVWLAERHTADVALTRADTTVASRDGDGLVTDATTHALGIWVGDCAPVALVAAEGVVAAVHVGWRGLAAGIVTTTLDVMRSLGGASISAAIGPCIHAECYEFGADDLDRLATQFGATVAASTAWGAPAFDLPAAVRVALGRDGVRDVEVTAACTACDGRYWSHRARGDRQRQGMAVWLEEAP